jgi:hypothetical protein
VTLDDAARILLNGITGCNDSTISKETGVSRQSVARYMTEGAEGVVEDTAERIRLFVWRRLNAHLLLSSEDYKPIDVKAPLVRRVAAIKVDYENFDRPAGPDGDGVCREASTSH